MHWVLVVNVPLPTEVLSTPFAPPGPGHHHQRHTRRDRLTQHGWLPSLLSDGDQRIEI
jgi:hypothetical protein